MNKIYKANEVLFPSTIVSTDLNSDAFVLEGYSNLGVVVTWATLNALDGEYSIEVSNDKTNWSALTSPVTMATAGGSDAVAASNAFFAYCRLKVTANSVTSGTISATITLKQ